MKPVAAEPTHETGKILRETEEFVLARRRYRCPTGRNLWTGSLGASAKISRGEAVIDRESDRFINQVHRDDIAAALFAADVGTSGNLGAPSIFNVVDDEPILASECYKWLAAKLQSTRCLRWEDRLSIGNAATATSG